MATSEPSGLSRRRRIVAGTLVVLLAGVLVADVLGVRNGFLPPSLGLPGLLDASGQNPDPSVDTAAERAAATRAVPPPDVGEAAAVTPTEKHQAALVDAEDKRLSALVSDGHSRRAPYVVAGAGQSLATEVLTPRPQPYGLPDLLRLGAAQRSPQGDWLLGRAILVVHGAQLSIRAPGATVRLTSGPHGIASVIAFKTTVTLAGGPGAPLTITSWDPDAARPDTETGDGRAYLRAVGARMDLDQVHLSDLGFWSGRTGGLAWTGDAGDAATGSMTGSVVQRCHYGLYTRRSTALAVSDTVLRGNDVDGLLARRDTTGLTVTRSTAADNGRNGVAIGDGAAHVALTGVVAAGNRVNGIHIDGQPPVPRTPPPALARTPAAPAARPAVGVGYAVTGATVTGNQAVGILISDADGVAVRNNMISGGRDGITLHTVAGTPQVTGNTVDVAEFGIALRSGRPGSVATLAGNRIGTALTGMQIVDTAAAVHANTVTGATRYGISLVGRVDATTVTANTIAGHGLAALDTVRVTPGVTPAVHGNDDSGWSRDIDYVLYSRDYVVTHPLVLLWALILLIPVTARLRSRRRRAPGRERQHPYRRGTAADAVAETDALTAVRPYVPYPRSARGAPEATTMLPVTRVTIVSQVRHHARR